MISICLPVVFVDFVDQLADEGVGVEQVVGQQQFGFVVDALEQEGHGGGQRVALGDQQAAVEFGVLVAGELEFDDLARGQAGEFDVWRRVPGFPAGHRRSGGISTR